MALNQPDGPIPGENYTSDTKNYAWHRPPEFDDLDKAIEYIGARLTSEESAVGVLAMMEAGIPVADLTQMFLMSGVGAGKWTLDFALLLAGPVAHMMQIMGKGYGIPINMGLDDKNTPPTKAFFEAVTEINRAKAKAAGRKAFDAIDDIEMSTSDEFKKGVINPVVPKAKYGGFRSASNPNEQSQMLGQSNPEEMM